MFTNRKDALNAGATQYFTGQKCKHGHVTHRYAQSGACAGCVAANAKDFRNEMMRDHRARKRVHDERDRKQADFLAAKSKRAEAMSQLAEIILLIDSRDLSVIFETAIAMCLMRFPNLTRDDVRPSGQQYKGSPRYKVLVPADQTAVLYAMGESLWVQRAPVDTTHIKHATMQLVDEQTQEPGDWAYKP
jgi:hypothetical protein